MSTVDKQIAEMKARLGVRKDAHLADKLGYSTAAIAQWKKRGEVPASAGVRLELVERDGRAAIAIKARKDQLDKKALKLGRELAIMLAPSLDAISVRFAHATFDKLVSSYAEYFDEIALACAEILERRYREHPGSWESALQGLTIGDTSAIYTEATQRAMWWRHGSGAEVREDRIAASPSDRGPTTTLHDPPRPFRGADEA